MLNGCSILSNITGNVKMSELLVSCGYIKSVFVIFDISKV